MRGKRHSSITHKANQEALARIAELEEENERMRAVENVSQKYIELLGENERLTKKTFDLEKRASESDRLDRALAAMTAERDRANKISERRLASIDCAARWLWFHMYGEPVNAFLNEMEGLLGFKSKAMSTDADEFFRLIRGKQRIEGEYNDKLIKRWAIRYIDRFEWSKEDHGVV